MRYICGILDASDPEPSRKISKIRNIYFVLAMVAAISSPVRLYSQEVLYPGGYEIISTYQLNKTKLSLSDTLIIRRTIINNDVFPLNGLFYSDNLPPAFHLLSYGVTVNGDSVSFQFSGGLNDFVIADYRFYEWVLDKPGTSDSIQNKINSGDTTVLELKFTSDSVGSFVLPLHAASFYGGGIAFYSSSDAMTVEVASSDLPPAPSNFIVQPGHEKCKLSWTRPTSGDYAGVMIRRNPWATGAYPEYDDAYSALGYPASPTEGELIYQGIAEHFTDSSATAIMPRNIYYYSIFSYDSAGNYSTVGPGQQGRATNYWLGDRSGDGSVYFEDLTPFSNAFYTSPGGGNYDPQFDIGPTDNGSPKGLPLTDNIINYEDLVIYALNYGVVGPNQKRISLFTDQSVSGPLGLSLISDSRAIQAGEEFTVRVFLQNNPGTVKAIHFVIPFDPSQVQLVGVDRNDDFKNTPAPLFFDGRERDKRVDVSIALLGGEVAMGGSGELGKITFRLLRSDPSPLSFELIDVRDGENHKLEAEDLTGYEAIQDMIPSHYGLNQNYPNPFNPTTSIEYSLPTCAHVTIEIFNLLGQHVRTLVDELKSAGKYKTEWDGTNAAGKPVSTGVYLYRFQAGDAVQTKKMLLIK